jgi:GT2 family glycosyltransferase
VGRSLSVRVRGHGAADDGSFDAPAGTPFAHGMCLVRRAVLDAVGGFDEGFGLGYFEELDLQLRARRKGFRVAYVPESVIVHATSKAFDRHPGGLKEELLARNWLRVMALHWPLRWLVARAPIDLARPARAWLDGADARPSLRALRTFAGMLPEVLARRRAIARSGPLDLAALRRETLDASHVNEPDTSREGDR